MQTQVHQNRVFSALRSRLRNRLSGFIPHHRYLHVQMSEPVRNALAAKKPVVALESTIITHGLPQPFNIEMAREVEEIILSEGCVPATTAFLNGVPHVGLTPDQLSIIATAESPSKISRRDIPDVIARKRSGGTTIAASMILAHKAGIKIFATGGLGGVHRGVAETMDVSADLEELAKTPVAVVCSGPKSILDVPKTIEYLETKGVPVYTRGPKNVDVPGFYTSSSGVVSPFQFESAKEAADILRAGFGFGLRNGYVICNPCPTHLAMDPALVNGAIELALAEAESEGISGTELTPFLLKKVRELTNNDSARVNVEFVKENARLAAQIAHDFYFLTDQKSASIQIPVQLKPQVKPEPKPLGPSTQNVSARVLVVGALAQDLTCTLETDNISCSSYPGRISTSIGGVGHNVALASSYTGAPTRLVSAIGEKERKAIEASLSPAIDKSGILVVDKPSSRYVSINDSKGDLVVACSDMSTVSQMNPAFITAEINKARPEVLVFDANLGPEQTDAVLNSSHGFKIYEPTSIPKSGSLAHRALNVFPNPSVNAATPNSMELMSMFEEFSFKEKFELQHWFPIIDAIPMDSPATQWKLNHFIKQSPAELGNIIQSGLVQAGIHLLPFIPNLFVKLGVNGVLSFQLIEFLKDRSANINVNPINSLYITNGRDSKFGVLVQHFPVPETIPQDKIKSVNGIGDTFCGVLAAQLVESQAWLRDDNELKLEKITKAQAAAGLSLQTFGVNSDISDLFY